MPAPDWLTARPIAHRGYHGSGREQNTLAAVSAAIDRDYAVEVDIRLTADGAAVVFHDATLDRLAGRPGRLSQMTAEQLGAVRLRATGDRIPILAELLDLVGGRVPLFLDLKVDDNSWRLAAAVATALRPYAGPAAVMAFEPATLIAMRWHAAGIPRGLILRRPGRLTWLTVAVCGVSFLAQELHCLAESGGPGLPRLAWTVIDAADRAFAGSHADQIIFEDLDSDALSLPRRTISGGMDRANARGPSGRGAA